MYNSPNTEGYGSTLQGRSSSGYSPYGATTQPSHLQPKDMVRKKNELMIVGSTHTGIKYGTISWFVILARFLQPLAPYLLWKT